MHIAKNYPWSWMLNMNWQNFPLSHAARAFCGHYWKANYSENFWLKIVRQNAQLGKFLCLVTFLCLLTTICQRDIYSWFIIPWTMDAWRLDSRLWPKPGFGIGNRNQGPIFTTVLEPKLFFSETETICFKKFQIFLLFWGLYVL